MQISSLSQGTQVARVRGEDVVAIGRQAYDSRVDGIGTPGSAEQYARSPPQTIVDGYDIDPGHQPGQRHRAPTASAPDLSHHPAAGDGGSAGQTFPLDERYNIPVSLLKREPAPAPAGKPDASPLR
ncbi:MAG TPA: hypothetical protein VGI00_26105 [Streptosporangiaceae bacterium]